ncbi:unnamed protein product [Parnassius apollo]|uniref:(apollo) hypothetical protein n=1 Tax=Parnassius apollo TaxID=110799 RepID=A0A8S3W2W3_PARAO|nr:unnamed protein product [Parnassius apollo]
MQNDPLFVRLLNYNTKNLDVQVKKNVVHALWVFPHDATKGTGKTCRAALTIGPISQGPLRSESNGGH